LASLKNLLSKTANSFFVLKYRLYINRPLRGLFYFVSNSAENLDSVENVLLNIPGFETENSNLDQNNENLFEKALNHWNVTVDITSNTGKDYLWGAGFYSKIIMLRQSERKFSGCVDSNPDFIGTSYSDMSLNELPILNPDEWLHSIAKRGDRIWLGVSSGARSAILERYEERLKMAGITIAF
jgi:hypothetical protein